MYQQHLFMKLLMGLCVHLVKLFVNNSRGIKQQVVNLTIEKSYICNLVHMIYLNALNEFVLAMTTTSSIVFYP